MEFEKSLRIRAVKVFGRDFWQVFEKFQTSLKSSFGLV